MKNGGDPTSQDYSSHAMGPFDQTPIKRNIGSIFSENDKFILNTFFYPFRAEFGYCNSDLKQFKINLNKSKAHDR